LASARRHDSAADIVERPRGTFFSLSERHYIVPTPQLGRVVLWMTGALLSFSATALSVRALAKALSIFEILSVRAGFGLLVMLGAMALWPRLRHDLSLRRFGLHLWRNTSHFAGQYFWSLAITLLPFATVFALEFTMPMWVAVMAVPFLGERMTTAKVGSIVLGFIGVLVIIRPGMESFQPAALLVLLAAFSYALSLIATKKLTAGFSTYAIIFWMNLLQLPMALAGSDLGFPAKLGWDALVPVLGIGIAGLSSHYCLANAFRFGDATVVVPLDFLRIPLIAVIGWMFYNEGLDVFVFLGAGLIVLGVLWNLRSESRRNRPPLGGRPEEAAIADA
jgi:drug/metabolite transporter (DMT)-like permease